MISLGEHLGLVKHAQYFELCLVQEELAADSSKVDLGRAVKKPSAPISLPAAGTKKIMTAEERELAELDAAMAG